MNSNMGSFRHDYYILCGLVFMLCLSLNKPQLVNLDLCGIFFFPILNPLDILFKSFLETQYMIIFASLDVLFIGNIFMMITIQCKTQMMLIGECNKHY